ncbi:MAG: radical SAM protein [Pseudomonadota bacterium]
MTRIHHLPVSPIQEGINVLRLWGGRVVGQTWSRPISINLLITSRCNSKCVTCDSWKLDDHESELTTDDYRRLAKETADLGIPIVTIGGGEPVLRQDLWEIIRAFKEAGRVVQLTTNGLTMRADQRRKMFESGLDRVTVSVDSHIPEIYAKIRGVDALSGVKENLLALLRERPPNLEVDTNTVLCSDNAETFLDTIDALISWGVPKTNFSAVTTAGENYLMVDNKRALSVCPRTLISQIVVGLRERKRRTRVISASSAFIHGLVPYFEHPDELVYPCLAGYLTLDVFQNGAVHGCGNLPAFGNVRNGSLTEIWKSRDAQTNRENMAAGRCPNCYLSCKAELAIAANPKCLLRFAIEKLG